MTISIDKSIKQEQEGATRTRQPTYKINPLILNRWSPRSMTGEELDDETIMSLFEAAIWAPSCLGDLYMQRETLYIGMDFSIC